MSISYDRFLEEARKRDDGPRVPDLVFGITPMDQVLSRNGYRKVLEQRGLAPGPTVYLGPLGSHRVSFSVYEYAAVKDEWASLFPPRPRVFGWDQVLVGAPDRGW